MTSSTPAEILSTVGHELRGPLTGVIGFAALLSSTNLTPEQREYLENLNHSAHSLLSQVNALLDLARLENQTLELEPSSVSFHEFIHESIVLSQRQPQDTKPHIESLISPDVPARIRVDRNRLQQVLGHLLEHATPFCKQGAMLLSASLQACAPTPSTPATIRNLLVEIRLSQPQISTESQNQILQAFRRGETSATRRSGTIGVGLTLCRKLIHLMGGQIGFDGPPQQDFRFWFTLPLVVQTSAEDETTCLLPPPRNHTDSSNSPSPSATSASPAPLPILSATPRLHLSPSHEKPCVLIVEDNTATARYLKQAITRLGCDTSVAHTLVEARTLLSERTFHIVLLDSELQGEDSLSLGSECASLQPPPPPSRTEQPPPPTVIAMAHEAIPIARQEELRIRSVLLKPLNTPQLLEAVQQGIESRKRKRLAW